MNIREPLVNIGFIGYGYWGPNVLRNLYQNPRAQVLIACDSSPQQNALLHEHYPTVEITANHEDVFNNPNIDAVCITTPAATHYALVKQALEAGKHVFVEKPMCSTVAEADTLISCAEQHDRILMVGHVYKYNKAVDIIKEVIDQGELGKIHYVRAIRTSLGPRIRADVNVVWDYAIHDLYIAMYLFGGRPERVRASGKSCLRSGIEDVVVIDLNFPGDIWVCIHCSWYEPTKARNMTIVGSKQMLVYDEMPPDEKVFLYRRGFAPAESQTDHFGNQDVSLFDEGLFAPHIDWQEPLRIECSHFLACIQDGVESLSDGHDGRNTLEVIHAVNESLQRNGQEIRLS